MVTVSKKPRKKASHRSATASSDAPSSSRRGVAPGYRRHPLTRNVGAPPDRGRRCSESGWSVPRTTRSLYSNRRCEGVLPSVVLVGRVSGKTCKAIPRLGSGRASRLTGLCGLNGRSVGAKNVVFTGSIWKNERDWGVPHNHMACVPAEFCPHPKHKMIS